MVRSSDNPSHCAVGNALLQFFFWLRLCRDRTPLVNKGMQVLHFRAGYNHYQGPMPVFLGPHGPDSWFSDYFDVVPVTPTQRSQDQRNRGA
jgi:hypothetical protein